MRCNIAAPRPRGNLLILKGLALYRRECFAMPPDGISIAIPKPSKGGASLTWEPGGDDLRPDKYNQYCEGGSFAGKRHSKEFRFFPQAPRKRPCARRFRGGGENAQTQAGELR
jgi:hypothetical protein